MAVKATDPHRAVAATLRMESPRLVAGLLRMVRDLALAEDLAQEALLRALERWPVTGIPEKPGAWLMTTAKRRAIDELRRRTMLARTETLVGEELQAGKASAEEALEQVLDDPVGDDLLRLVFVACHPVLSREARVALTLRLLGGLTTDEIARAFLVSEATIAQRIVRAKRTLLEGRVPYEIPRGPALTARLASVLEVLYLIFNEGYSATAGDDWIRPALCDEALRLGRVLAELAPGEAEVQGLVALMEIQASRLRARVGPDGGPILLLDQDRARWDALLIGRGLRALERARSLGGPPGPYRLQAEIAACHARARRAEDTDWRGIASLYARLQELDPSPIVELNRAVAISMAEGPAPALALVDRIAVDPALEGYHLLPSVRGDLLAKLGRHAEAREEFERAASWTRNLRERALLSARAAEAARASAPASGASSRGESPP